MKKHLLKRISALLLAAVLLAAAAPSALADDPPEPPSPAPAPTLTAGATARSDDDAAGTVSFTSDQDGEYYYAVIPSGEPEPTFHTTDAGAPCAAGVAVTIALTELSQGAKDVYIVVKNAEGTCSAALCIPLPASPMLRFSFSADAASCAPGGAITVQLRVRAKTHCSLGSFTGGFQFPAAFTFSDASVGTATPGTGSALLTYTLPAEAPLSLSTGDTTLLTFKLTADAAAAVQNGTLSLSTASTAAAAPDGSALDYRADALPVAVVAPPPLPEAPANPRWGDGAAGGALWDAVSGQTYGVELYKDGDSELNLVPAGTRSGLADVYCDFYAAIAASGSGSYRFRVRAGAGAWSALSAERRFYTIHLPTGAGFTLTPGAGSVSPLPEGGAYAFTITLDKGYFKGKNFAVKVNGAALTPDDAGVYTISAVAADQTVAIEGLGAGTTIADLPVIATESLPDAAMGAAYSRQLELKEKQSVKWSVVGSLPTGLTLSQAGLLSGTPARPGAWTFTVQATNSIGSAKKRLTLTVSGASYTFSGDVREWTRGGEGSLTFTANAKGELAALMIDGAELAPETEGAALSGGAVTLDAAYLNTLTMGEHLVTLYYADGSADGAFTVVQADPTIKPSITQQPADCESAAGGALTFSVTAEGTLPLLCQWQVDRGDGSGFVRLKNATASSYTLSGVSADWDGYRFRCVVTNEAGEAVSEAATLRVSGGAAEEEQGGSGKGLTVALCLVGAAGLGALGWFGWKRLKGRKKDAAGK